MSIDISPSLSGFGANIRGVDLSSRLDEDTTRTLRNAWLAHQVVSFPDQPLTHDQLERFTTRFGEFGDDPYVEAMAGHANILEIRRDASEKASPFGSSWHSDWSFQQTPPAATILHAKVVPPVGGDTWFANSYAAFDALDDATRQHLGTLTAIHSARGPYSRQGYFANNSEARSMTILPNDSALSTQEHPLIRSHPETGRKCLWVNSVYTIGIKGMSESESRKLLKKLCEHSVQPQFVYKLKWQPDMLTMWDNRCVQHSAQGGYDGYQRIMHRTTVAGSQPYL
ncbi:MAG: TauD/TfdA family dioxygenase [Proteobacteria bacterium]|nr:TauD/TfdA family dioxygenase [Pseudomonadota bacterium]